MGEEPSTADCRVWLGSKLVGYCGCGIIVDPLHVVSCNHVVRQCLRMESWGKTDDDLVGCQVLVKHSENVDPVAFEVTRNRPLPLTAFGAKPDHDLALLRRVDGEEFPENRSALLATQDYLDRSIEREEQFVGTGLGKTAGSLVIDTEFTTNAESTSNVFQARLVVSAQFKFWYHTSEEFAHLITAPGCSGAAALSPRNKRLVLGLVQGGLKDQVGFVIPAHLIAAFAKAGGARPTSYDEDRQRQKLPTPFASIRRQGTIQIRDSELAQCDRVEQAMTVVVESQTRFEDDETFLFLLVAGSEHDCPDLSNRRCGEESIETYWKLVENQLNERRTRKHSTNFPIIAVRPGAGFKQLDYRMCLALLADGFTEETKLRKALDEALPKERNLAQAMNRLDSPIVVTIEYEERSLSKAALESWLATVANLAHARGSRPIIALLFVHSKDAASFAWPEHSGAIILPSLGAITRSDVGDWVKRQFRASPEKQKVILGRVQKDEFSMAELRNWLSSTD